MGDRRERSAFGGFFTFLKFIFACTPHSCVLFLNVPNLRFTKSIEPWYSQLVVENRCSGVVRSQSKK